MAGNLRKKVWVCAIPLLRGVEGCVPTLAYRLPKHTPATALSTASQEGILKILCSIKLLKFVTIASLRE
jgi:hypothetical protein